MEAPNWFVRILSLLFLCLLSGLAIASFLFTEPKFGISSGILSVIGIMTVLILAEAFHTLSVGKFLTLSRQVKDAEKEKSELKKDNADLRALLISFATNVHQSQVTTNISGADLPLLRQALGVIPAAQSKEEEEVNEQEKRAPRPAIVDAEDIKFRVRLLRRIELILLEKFLAKYSLSSLDLLRKVEFGMGIESVDPIMSGRVIYDGYIKTAQKEYFIATKGNHPSLYRIPPERMYVMLAKILFYRQAKKTEAELVLLLPEIPEWPDEHWYRWPDGKELEWFQPAIGNGLLRIESFAITQEEYEHLKRQARNEIDEADKR